MKNTTLSIFFFLSGITAVSGQTWTQIPVPTSKQLNAIDFPSATVGYIGGNDSLLLKTTDGGQTWQRLSYSGVTFYPGNEHIINLQFVSETTGYMAIGPYTGTYKTTNGGTSWQPVTASPGFCHNEGLFFFDENNGFIAGSGCFQGELIDRQSNGAWSAATLTFSTSDAENRISDIDFHASGFGIATSLGGRFLRTSDNGQTWDSVISPLGTNGRLTSVAIVNDTLCFAGYETDAVGFGLLISTDAGLTWNEDMSSATFFYPDFYDVHVTGSGAVYTGGKPAQDNTGILFSMQSPDGWWNNQTVVETIYSISSYNDSIVFAVGNNGYVITNANPAELSVKELDLQAELTVWPNPVEETVHFDSPVLQMDGETTFRIYDAAGKMVQEGEAFHQEINVQSLRKGAYFLEIGQYGRNWNQRFVKE